MTNADHLRALLRASPVVLAPMEDVTDAAFRRVARRLGAELCVTEFIAVEQLVNDGARARRRAQLAADDQPTAIQIYGSDPQLLLAAARIVERAAPAFIDINCGCWIPKIARRGAGAGWLRDPRAMVAMAREVVAAVALPVTVKTRIGWGPESEMPIIDLARRLEDVGVAALTIHCRTAAMGHTGAADWTWAKRARDVVDMPVIVNGDVRTPDDAVRALAETGCAGAMIGRAAIDDPWVIGAARARLAGAPWRAPTMAQRRAVYRTILDGSIEARGERAGVASAKRHSPLLGAALRARVLRAVTLDETLDVLALDDAEARAASEAPWRVGSLPPADDPPNKLARARRELVGGAKG